MEEIQNEMRANRGKKEALRDVRAMEKMARHNQLERHSNQLIPKDPHGMPPSGSNLRKLNGLGSGGEAGLARVIGKGRRRKAAAAEPESESSDEEMEGGRKYMGKMLAKHLQETHGGRYMKKFMKGMGGIQVEHAQMAPAAAHTASGGQDVPPGGIAPRAYGNAPQAPASFQRNTVGMGMTCSTNVGSGKLKITHSDEMAGAGKLSIQHGEGKPKRTNARGQMISKLMKEKGMTLPEASRYLKEHGSA
jgi:hypothetical protein